jgi:acetyl esterase/lipase
MMKRWFLLALLLVLAALPLGADRRRPVRRIEYGIEIVRGVTYGVGGAFPLELDFVRPKGAGEALPVVVFVHGGGWSGGDKAAGINQLSPLARRGYVGATINYRLSGQAKFPAQIEDVKCAIRYLRANAAALGIDPERIAVWGSSAGGHLVSLLGTTADVEEWNRSGGWSGNSSRVAAVIDWYGPANLNTMASQALPCSTLDHDAPSSPESQLLGCAVPTCRERAALASPVSWITPDDAPTLLMHGTNDCTVPPKQSEEFHAKLREAGIDARLILLPGAGHGGPQFTAALETVYAFIDEQLR